MYCDSFSSYNLVKASLNSFMCASSKVADLSRYGRSASECSYENATILKKKITDQHNKMAIVETASTV